MITDALADQAQRAFALLLAWRREAAFVVTPLGFILDRRDTESPG
jgi:hypothetical protein